MKIGFFCNEFPPRAHGGIGTFVEEITRALVCRGHEVTVVEFGKANRERSENGVRIVTLAQASRRGVAWLANRVKLLFWLARAARKGEIDIFEIPDFQGWLPFPFEPCPIVVRLHLAQTHVEWLMGAGRANRSMYWLERQTLRYHPHWIGVSQYILEAQRAFFRSAPRMSVVIHCPIALADGGRESKSSIPGGPFFLFVGSVSERKGALALAEAVAPLLEENPRLSLVFVGAETEYGGRPISDEIRRRVGATAAERVAFLGWLPRQKVLAWMARATAVCLPSRIESFGLVIAEAMSVGAPVVYSKEGPGPELVEDGVTGLLVDPENVEEIRLAIRRLLTDPAYARALGDNARQAVVARFSIDRCVAQTLAFYEKMLGRDDNKR